MEKTFERIEKVSSRGAAGHKEGGGTEKGGVAAVMRRGRPQQGTAGKLNNAVKCWLLSFSVVLLYDSFIVLFFSFILLLLFSLFCSFFIIFFACIYLPAD